MEKEAADRTCCAEDVGSRLVHSNLRSNMRFGVVFHKLFAVQSSSRNPAQRNSKDARSGQTARQSMLRPGFREQLQRNGSTHHAGRQLANPER